MRGPSALIAFLFGLSMDYQVFIISRMREAYDRTGSTQTAVVEGIGRTGRLVTSAALILGLAFVALSASPGTDVKIFATALAAGILLDATIVRGMLVPAVVSIVGRWNWWLPHRPARVLRVEASPSAPSPLPRAWAASPVVVSERVDAVELFAPLGPTYDRYARLLSLGQDPRWRRFLVSRVQVGWADTVLDVATGTAAVAIDLTRRTGCCVVGLDQSPEMLEIGRRRVEAARLDRIELVEGAAERLPFEDASFDALTFAGLLRYVDDPGATMRELARVVRPGGMIAMFEFGLPRGLVRGAWELYVRIGLPALGTLVSPRLAPSRILPRTEHPRVSPALRPARAVAERRDRGRSLTATLAGRCARALGTPL